MNRAERSEVTHPQLVDLCRKLRARSTDAESLLWSLVRARQIAGVKFRRQHPFGVYILDFYAHDACLVLELDGDGHAQPAQAALDAVRTGFLEKHGLTVLRFANRDVLLETEAVLTRIWNQVTRRPHPDPLPPGEGTVGHGPTEE